MLRSELITGVFDYQKETQDPTLASPAEQHYILDIAIEAEKAFKGGDRTKARHLGEQVYDLLLALSENLEFHAGAVQEDELWCPPSQGFVRIYEDDGNIVSVINNEDREAVFLEYVSVSDDD